MAGTDDGAETPLRRPHAGWLVATGLASSAVVALANREPLMDDILMSINDYWSQGGRRSVLLMFLQPILGALLSLLLAVRPVRTAAAAALAVLGLAGFLSLLGYFGSGLTALGETDYGRGLGLGLLGSALMLAAGVAAGFGAASPPSGSAGPALAGVVGGVTGFLLLGPMPYLMYRLAFWYFLPLAALLATAVVLSRAVRRLTPAAGGGALVALGLAIGASYADLFGEGFDPLEVTVEPVLAIDVVILAGALLTTAGLVLLGRAGRDDSTWGSAEGRKQRPAGAGDDPIDGFDGTRSEATRHLCVAMHLDRDLSRRAMREVVDGDAKAIAPSLGIDFGVVVRHCLLARNRQRVRDAVLVCVAAIALVVTYAALVEGQAAALRYLLPVLVVGWLAVAVEQLVARHLVVARHLSRERFAGRRPVVLDDSEERRVLALERLERGNVTPYGGFFPFVGSGQEVGGWSFALSVLKGSEGIGGERLEPLAFDLGDLYETVRQDVDRLDVEGLTVEDRLYVDGEEMAADRRFLLPGPPATLRTEIGPEQLRELVRAPERVNRVYRCIRVYGWSGEYVLSVYLNVARAGQGLFAEARYFLLLPPKPQLVALGQELSGFSVGAVLRTLGASLRSLPRLLVAAVRGLSADVRALSRPPARVGGGAPVGVNHGATTSLRELAQGTAYRRYFQRIDSEMTTKIVERQLLDSIARFLREHRIDTSELQERQSAILNYGLIVSGGNVSAGSMAVGQNAQSMMSRIGAAIRPPSDEGATK